MRFGKTLRLSVYKPWKSYYIDYPKLKKLLREDEDENASPSRQKDDIWTDEDAENFYHELTNVQLEKVQSFHQETYQKLRDRAAACEAILDPIAVSAHTPIVSNDEIGDQANQRTGSVDESTKSLLQDTLKELDEITKETSELEKYSRINYTGFIKIAKKHDRKRGGRISVRGPLQSLLVKVPFNQEDYSPLLYRISAMYSFIRQRLDGKEPRLSFSDSASVGEDYTAHKFWVHPDNILEVKTNILRRLPVLVYNPMSSKIADVTQRDPTVTTVYFDNSAFELYNAKVEHSGPASSLRLRWYDHLNDTSEIFLEKKTVGQDDVSSERRLTIKEKHISSFINGEYNMDKEIKRIEARAGSEAIETQSLKKSVEEISEFIRERKLQPVVRANFTRTAFQMPRDERIRISLDTNLAFIREDAVDTDRPIREPDNWHRKDIDDAKMEFPFNSIRKGEVSRFPFAILEIKVRGHKQYEWIDELVSSHLVREAPRFSKFVHGVAQLFEDYVNVFPFWLAAIETDIRQAPEDAFKQEQKRRQSRAEDEQVVGSLLGKSTLTKAMQTPPRKITGLSLLSSPIGLSHTGAHSLDSSAARDSPITPITPKINIHPPEDVDDEVDHINMQPPLSRLDALFPGFISKSRRTRDAPLPPGVVKPERWIKDEGTVKVEAKVWLANQRTFIKWQHVSVLLASLSLGLFNAAGQNNSVAKGLALMYTSLAVIMGCWGWAIFVWRSRLIEKRSGKDFDALSGPIITCIGLMIALSLNFVFKVSNGLSTCHSKDCVLTCLQYNELKKRPTRFNWEMFGISPNVNGSVGIYNGPSLVVQS